MMAMQNTFLVVTSIASSQHPVLNKLAGEAAQHHMPFIVIGDTKSPSDFNLANCDFYSVQRQCEQEFALAKLLPTRHYARKNIGYLLAAAKGAEVIIETDDDNYPYPEFWNERTKIQQAHPLQDKGWVNVYRYFTDVNTWPRGFSLSDIRGELPILEQSASLNCPIQQGLADDNPDVDAIFRLVDASPVKFSRKDSVALGRGCWCPFNSQNTTWFKEAFPLLYLPSYCSFRMTDIWRSFVAQRICWENGWHILFHNATVWQERNDHNLMQDFSDEIQGYLHNPAIAERLAQLPLKSGVEHIAENLLQCYELLIAMNLIDKAEVKLVEAWLKDITASIDNL
jgi:hypothetical protein